MTAARTVEPVRRDVYFGRTCLGWYCAARDGSGFDAFASNDKPLGRFTSEGAAIHAIQSGLLPRQDGTP